jgi:monoamine oxidase
MPVPYKPYSEMPVSTFSQFCTLFLLLPSFVFATPKVAVVGAGLAGLTTAYRLQQQGFDVDVYEARERVGGRVFTVSVDGCMSELGGQNISDGGDAEHLLALAEELGLETEGDTVELYLRYLEGEELRDVHQELSLRQLSPEKMREDVENAKRYCANMEEILQAIFSPEDLLCKASRIVLSAYEGLPPERLGINCSETLLCFLAGGLSPTHQEEGIVEHLWIKGGNGLLPKKLAEILIDRVHLGSPLKALEKTADGRYCLSFQQGNQAVADIVVLAIPCPVYEDIAFPDQVIPVTRLQMIGQVPYGINSKILVTITPYRKWGDYSNDRCVVFRNLDLRIANIYYFGNCRTFLPSEIIETFEKELPLLQHVGSISVTTAPVVAKDVLFSSYLGPVGHCWPLDPYVKGSYSCVGPQGMVSEIFAPIDETLYFAGEHTTSSSEIIGTMEAAVRSGDEVAEAIRA